MDRGIVSPPRPGGPAGRGATYLGQGFAEGVAEYKEIGTGLERHGVLDTRDAALLRTLAGYRNRMVHFYHEVSAEELLAICTHQRGDVEQLREALARWVREHPDKVDAGL